jgi:lipoate-protein ligase A
MTGGGTEIQPYDLADAMLPLSLDDGPTPAGGDRPVAWTVFAPRTTAVVLGKSNDPEGEVRLDHVRADGVALLRRPSGGHTVLLTPRTAVAAIAEGGRPLLDPARHFGRFCAILIRALERLGVRDLALKGTSDLAVGDRKIVGSSIYLSSRYAFFHAVVNLSEDPGLIARYLRMPPREPDYRRGRSHAEFVTSLAAEGHDIAAGGLERAVGDELRRLFPAIRNPTL